MNLKQLFIAYLKNPTDKTASELSLALSKDKLNAFCAFTEAKAEINQ